MANRGKDIENVGYMIMKIGLLLLVIVIAASCLGAVLQFS